MAIHVRPVNRTRRILLQRLRTVLTLAALISLGSLLVSGLILYFNYILIEGEKAATFSYVQIEKEQTIAPPQPKINKDLSGGAPSSSTPNIIPDVIVSTTTDAITALPDVSSELGEGLDSSSMNGLGLGFGSLGDGLGEGTGTGSGKGSGSGSGRNINSRAGYNDDIQIVLALDASGSMDQLFTAVANSLENVLITLSNAKLNDKKTKVNVGIVVYGQAKSNGAPFALSKFTTRLNQLRGKVKETACDGYNEECGNAIRFAVKHFPWNMRERDDMLKVIFICGNEPFDMGPVDYRDAIAEAQSKNIIVNTVYCGSEDEQWQSAAELGNGVGICYEMMPGADDQEMDYNAIWQVLKKLTEQPLMPAGAPAVQQEYLRRYGKLAPPPKTPKQITTWLGRNREHIINGYEWDAVEICRRRGIENFTLSHIGGRGNLPLSLRGMSDEEALQAIQDAARKKSELLEEYKNASKGGDFATQILEILREQALEKGINIVL